jgi:hypothetical protein
LLNGLNIYMFSVLWYQGICRLLTPWYVQNVSTFPNTFAIVSPLICVFWIQLTRTNAVFSRIALVSHFCVEIRLLGKIPKNIAKILFCQKTHRARRGDEGGQRPGLTTRGRSPALAAPTCGEAVMRYGVDIFSPSSWEPQEEGMMNKAARFSLS